MLTPIILVLGLMLATAVIAYWSDNLGKKLGKKRVSLWNLRPRTTATLLTIVSSWVIMLFTLAVLLAVFRPLRHALLRYDRERAENLALRQELTSLNGNVKKLEAQRSRLEGQTKQISNDLKVSSQSLRVAQSGEKAARQSESQARRQEKTARRAQLTAERAENQARTNESQARRSEVQARRNEAGARQGLIDVRRRFADAKQQLNVARQQFSSVEKQLVSTRDTLVNARAQLSVTKSTLSRTEENLQTTQGNLKVSKANLKTAQLNVTEAQKSVRKQLAQIEEYEGTLAEKENRLAELGKMVQEAELLVASLNHELSIADVARTGRTSIPYNLTFASRVVEPGLGSSAANQFIRSLMNEAREIARKDYENLPLQLEPIAVKSGEQPRLLTEEQVVEMLAEYLQTFKEPVSVRVVSVRDHAVGEPIIKTQFVAIPVRTALQTGATLAQASIDGRQSDAKIFSQLQKLVDDGRQFAERERGIEPAFTKESPNFFASGTNERIFEALRKVQAAKRPVTVRLVAAEELSTVEALRVRFEIGDEKV